MTDPLDPSLSALERRLGRVTGGEPSPALRHRLLVAVDDALVEPVISAGDARAGAMPIWAWAAAVAVGMAFMVPVIGAAAALGRVEPLSFASRLRAAGLADYDVRGFVPEPHDAATMLTVPTANFRTDRSTLRVTGVRELLEENL